MGLVGNVAEVKHLRNRLMKSEFITVFSNLLDSDSDGIEVTHSKRKFPWANGAAVVALKPDVLDF